MAEAAYTAKDITVLEGLEPVRLRPGMYIGSTGSRGLHHLVYEVVDNAVDEALAGRNDLVDVTIHPDNSVTVRDAGAGIPVDMIDEQGLPALTVVLTKLHAGGKFGGDGYKVSGGLHGVGVSVVNALSEWLVAEVRRDGKVYRQEFARGEPAGPMETTGVAPKNESGTDDLVPSRLGGLRGDRVRRGDADAAPARDGVPHTRSPHHRPRRARRREDGGVPLRGRYPRLRRVRQRVEGHRPQARRLRRGRERRRPRRDRDAVEQLVRRVGLLVREQHQHDRGRRPPLGVQGRADRDAQPLRPGQGSLEGEGGQPRGRGRPRGARSGHLRQASEPAVRGADEDEAREPGRGRPRQDHREPEARRVPRGEPNRCAADHHEGGLGVPSPASGAQGTRADAAEERPRVQLAPGPSRRLPDQRSRGGGALSRGGPLCRRLSGRRARPDVPGDPSAARQGDQRREEPNQQGSFQRGDPGDHHGHRHGHCGGVRRLEAPLPPRDRHDGRRRGRRAHPDADPHIPLPADAGARRAGARLHRRRAALPREDRKSAALRREGVPARGHARPGADQGHGCHRPSRRDPEAHRGAVRTIHPHPARVRRLGIPVARGLRSVPPPTS